MKRFIAIITVVSLFSASFLQGQAYDYAMSAMANFLQRHYESQPFEGLREIEDYHSKYIEVVLTMSADKNTDSNSSRVLFLKASRLVSEFENGIRIADCAPITVNDSNQSNSTKVTVYSSSGITGKLSLLTSFSHKDKIVYIYIKKR